jgi:hypothetical protein
MAVREPIDAQDTAAHEVCPLYHEAVEMVGRRWTGAILRALMDGPLRFSEVAATIPELSDRLLSERMKELEGRGLVIREVTTASGHVPRRAPSPDSGHVDKPYHPLVPVRFPPEWTIRR